MIKKEILWVLDDELWILEVPGTKLLTQPVIIMLMLSEVMNQSAVYLEFVLGSALLKEVVKGIVMDPCVQLFT